jgi:hypothetical protein
LIESRIVSCVRERRVEEHDASARHRAFASSSSKLWTTTPWPHARAACRSPSESEHGHRMAHRLDQVGALRSPDPFRHHDALGVHVLQAVFFTSLRPLIARSSGASHRADCRSSVRTARRCHANVLETARQRRPAGSRRRRASRPRAVAGMGVACRLCKCQGQKGSYLGPRLVARIIRRTSTDSTG